MYPVQKPSRNRSVKARSTMPTGGVNELYLTQFLKPNQATKILNWFIRQETELYERQGIAQRARIASTTATKIFRPWTDTLFVLGYGTVLTVFNSNDDTFNTIKSNFSANITGMIRYGRDFFSCNSRYGDKIYKTTLPTLNYDGQTVNFTAGKVVTGGTSGATATIVVDTDAGATGTLALDNITGVFQNNEAITDSAGGAAVADGTVTWTNTAEITASAGTVPKCEALGVYDKSLVAINTNNSEFEVLLAKQNDETNWDTTAVAVGSAYSLRYDFAGEAKCTANFQSAQSGLASYGNILVCGFASGYAGFERTSVTIGATVTQIFHTVFEKINDGMERNALSTPQGIYFANENGIFLLVANMNGERVELTRNIKRSRKADFDFSNVDFAWSALDNRLYVTLKENASVNNLILWFDTTTINSKQGIIWGEIPYSVSSFFTIQNKLYGAASASPRVLEMFSEGQLDDEGASIDCIYEQPVNVGSLETVKDLLQIDCGGDISPGAPLTVQVLGISEEGGTPADTGVEYTWTSAGMAGAGSELGVAELGVDGFGATPAAATPVWTPATGYKKLYGYNSYLLKVSSSDKLPAVVRYLTATISERRNQRKNVLTAN